MSMPKYNSNPWKHPLILLILGVLLSIALCFFLLGCDVFQRSKTADAPVKAAPLLSRPEDPSLILGVLKERLSSETDPEKVGLLIESASKAAELENRLTDARVGRDLERSAVQNRLQIELETALAKLEQEKARAEMANRTLNRLGWASLVSLGAVVPAYFVGGFRMAGIVLLISGLLAAWPSIVGVVLEDLRPYIKIMGIITGTSYAASWAWRWWLDAKSRYLRSKHEDRAATAVEAIALGRTSEKWSEWRKQRLLEIDSLRRITGVSDVGASGSEAGKGVECQQ